MLNQPLDNAQTMSRSQKMILVCVVANLLMPTRKFMVLLLTAAVACGQSLTWEPTTRELKSDGNQPSVSAVFPFKNTGGKPVVITSAMPSCDCVTTKLEKEFYTPGESGKLRVEMTLGGRTGRQEKTITVTTDDAPDKPTVLRLIVDIFEPVTIRPQAVFWQTGEPVAEKLIEITLGDPKSAAIGDAQCSEPAFVVRLEPGGEPGRYRMLVRPLTTSKPVQAPLRLSATVNGRPRVFVLYAAVK